jgi:hypothetical protein
MRRIQVIVRGYTTVGAVTARLGSVSIDAREFTDAGNSHVRVTGLSIEVKEAGRLERENTSFVDYDEIDSLIQGIDYISKMDQHVTLMKNFEAEYRTKGDFRITTFNSSEGIDVSVSSGRIGKATAFMKLADLPRLRALIVNAKATIDSASQGAK